MLDLADDLRGWLAAGREFAVATVISVGGSAPRGPGAARGGGGGGAVVGGGWGGGVGGAG